MKRKLRHVRSDRVMNVNWKLILLWKPAQRDQVRQKTGSGIERDARMNRSRYAEFTFQMFALNYELKWEKRERERKRRMKKKKMDFPVNRERVLRVFLVPDR